MPYNLTQKIIHAHLKVEKHEMVLKNKTKNMDIPLKEDYTTRQRDILLAGGLLNYTKEKNRK